MRISSLLATALAATLLLAGCASGSGSTEVGASGDNGGASGTAAGAGEFAVADVCHAIDQDIVAAEVGPVREVEEVDELYCNLWLDLPGLGNSINVSFPPPAGMGPNEVFEGTVQGRAMMANTEAQSVESLGDRAAAIQTDMGAVVIVQLGDNVVVFDPMLADGQITLDSWQRILQPALSTLRN